MKAGVTEQEKIVLLQAIQRAHEEVSKGETSNLPAYLIDALSRYEKAFWSDVDRRIIGPKLVKRFSHEGLPISRDNREGKTALTEAAALLNVSVQTVERWLSESKKTSP